MTRSRRVALRIHVVAVAALAGLLLAGLPSAAAGGPQAAPDRQAAPVTAPVVMNEDVEDDPEAALDAAQELFTGTAPPRGSRALARALSGPAAEHASLVLRELAAGLHELDRRDRTAARRILARPTNAAADDWPAVKYDGAPTAHTCTGQEGAAQHVCVHWVTDAAHRDSPPTADVDGDDTPDWVETTRDVLEHVWQRTVVDLGYRSPLSDATSVAHGPDGRTDIYLAELGETHGLYGYCVPEPVGRQQVAPAYCVLDNDYAEFPGQPLGVLQATAAHEFFHVVQAAYHVAPEAWVAEGTAAWVEDEIFDHVDDNHQYLTHSALRFPRTPLDFTQGTSFKWYYGSWIYWRFLTELLGPGPTSDPLVVRRVWERIGAGRTTLAAVRGALAARGTSFDTTFALFGAVNRVPAWFYEEGRSYGRFVAAVPTTDRFVVARGRSTGWRARTLRRLSNHHLTFRPGPGARRLRLQLDLPPLARASGANVVVQRRDGTLQRIRVVLDRRGDARVTVPFDPRRVVVVAVTLTNSTVRTLHGYRVRGTGLR